MEIAERLEKIRRNSVSKLENEDLNDRDHHFKPACIVEEKLGQNISYRILKSKMHQKLQAPKKFDNLMRYGKHESRNIEELQEQL